MVKQFSGNQSPFLFTQSPGIYYQSNKGYVWSFYLLKNCDETFFYESLFKFEQIDNIRAVEEW